MTSYDIYIYFVLSYTHHRDLHSFPTRRSSDLPLQPGVRTRGQAADLRCIGRLHQRKYRHSLTGIERLAHRRRGEHRDRKSTRLNSSHANISYAVFCLKKKKKTSINMRL